MIRILLSISLSLVVVGHASAETETVTIPLDQISGSGTRGLRALEPELFVDRDTPGKWEKFSTPEGYEEMNQLAAKSLVLPIERAMRDMPSGKDTKVGSGFAVRGTGREAVQGIYDVLVKNRREDRNSLLADFTRNNGCEVASFNHSNWEDSCR